MKIFDMHNDFITADTAITYNEQKVIGAIWCSELSQSSVEQIASCQYKYMAIEDMCCADLSNIEWYIARQFLYYGLTWNTANSLAGGCYSEQGLTHLGKQILNRLVASGKVIDTAHMNKKSFWQVVGSSAKIICSHTAFGEVHIHPRNIDRHQIEAIISSGGIVGLTFVPEFITTGKHAAVGDIVAHIDYFANTFGIEYLAIGSDYFGTWQRVIGLENYHCWQLLFDCLAKLGYTKGDIDKLFFTNANKYFFTNKYDT